MNGWPLIKHVVVKFRRLSINDSNPYSIIKEKDQYYGGVSVFI